MKKTAAIVLITLMILFLPHFSVSANDAGAIVDEQRVTISLTNTGLQVDEEIKVTNINKGNETISSLQFWIQQDIQNAVKITERNSGKELVPLIIGNIRTCNLSAANLSIIPDKSMTFQLTYYLPTNTQYFIKTLKYNTTEFSVSYENRDLFLGTQLYSSQGNNEIQIRLYNPTEAPLNITTIVIIFVVVIIILAVLLLLLKRQRSKAKKTIAESEETLTTKKTLLLSLLKDLEKQYRAQSISD
jgi:hypothetical protein